MKDWLSRNIEGRTGGDARTNKRFNGLGSQSTSFIAAIFAIIALLAMATVITPIQLSMIANAATANLVVISKDSNGNSISGYYTTVSQSGSVKATGYTPASFTLPAGTYVVSVSDYGGYYFNHWSDGSTSRTHSVTVTTTGTITLTAIYSTSAPATTTIIVKTRYVDGTYFNGAVVDLKQNGVKIASKTSPATFTVNVGQTYSIVPGDTTTATFKQWKNGLTARERTFTASSTSTTYYAIYSKVPSSGGSCSGSAGGANTVKVVTCALDGTPLTGFYTNLRLNGNIMADGYTPKTFTMTPGNTYVVVLYWCCDYQFRHYSDGTLTRYYEVTPSSSGKLIKGLYELVPASQAAKLNVIAKDTNGKVIGSTTTNPDGTISTQPGMWMWLTPPGASSPYTGAYTGSSSTPFVIFNGKTYTVTMSSFGSYQFDHWQDNGSTNPKRAFSMNGDSINNVAVYRIVASATATATSSDASGQQPPQFIDVDHHR